MSLWRQLTAGLRVLTRRGAADQDVRDEVADYLERSAAEQRARGLSPGDARRAARVEIGSETMVREDVRRYGWENIVSTFVADLRHGARQLRRAPGFTAVTVFTLALGIGATTTIFSAVNPILFRALPYPHPERIVTIYDAGEGDAHQMGTFATFSELSARNHTFDAISVMKPWQPTLTGSGDPERLEGQRVSASYFRVLGVAPAIGRDISASDDRLNGPAVVVLSDALWRRRFNADPAIVGRLVTLDDNSFTVIGVMPPGFANIPSPAAALWAPLQYDMTEPRVWGHHLRTIGRLRESANLASARDDLNGIARSLVVKQPEAFGHPAQGVTPLQAETTRDVRPALFAVLGAVLLVLIIACVNVMNLLLARGVTRQGEFAMRAALGAGRGRMVRQLLTESLLLAALGGAAGLALAQFGVRAVATLTPADLPMANAIALDGAVFAFGFALTALVALSFGLLPAMRVARSGLHSPLQQLSRRSAGGHHVMRRALVVAEVALALVLLVASGLMLRTLDRFFSVPPGFEPAHVITMQVQTVGHRYDSDTATFQLFARMLGAVRDVPGVTSAAFTSQLPLSGDDDVYGVHLEADGAPTEDSQAFRYGVSAGYLETMGIPLRRGRLLDARDALGAPGAVLVNESYARRKFPGADPVGRRVHVGPTDRPWYTIVGVVGDVKQQSLAATRSDAIYMPTEQSWFADHTLWLVARTRGDPATLAPAIRAAIWSVDHDQPIDRVATMSDLLAHSGAQRRFAMVLFTAFAIVALVLAAAGIYGVLSGSVTERTREIGVRAALGASRAEIRNLILRQGMALAGAGAIIGIFGAMAASRALATMLFGVSPLDPTTYAGVSVLLLIVAALACWLPAWRAARVDPGITLRAD